jgi:hypothetical protein
MSHCTSRLHLGDAITTYTAAFIPPYCVADVNSLQRQFLGFRLITYHKATIRLAFFQHPLEQSVHVSICQGALPSSICDNTAQTDCSPAHIVCLGSLLTTTNIVNCVLICRLKYPSETLLESGRNWMPFQLKAWESAQVYSHGARHSPSDRSFLTLPQRVTA